MVRAAADPETIPRTLGIQKLQFLHRLLYYSFHLKLIQFTLLAINIHTLKHNDKARTLTNSLIKNQNLKSLILGTQILYFIFYI